MGNSSIAFYVNRLVPLLVIASGLVGSSIVSTCGLIPRRSRDWAPSEPDAWICGIKSYAKVASPAVVAKSVAFGGLLASIVTWRLLRRINDSARWQAATSAAFNASFVFALVWSIFFRSLGDLTEGHFDPSGHFMITCTILAPLVGLLAVARPGDDDRFPLVLLGPTGLVLSYLCFWTGSCFHFPDESLVGLAVGLLTWLASALAAREAAFAVDAGTAHQRALVVGADARLKALGPVLSHVLPAGWYSPQGLLTSLGASVVAHVAVALWLLLAQGWSDASSAALVLLAACVHDALVVGLLRLPPARSTPPDQHLHSS